MTVSKHVKGILYIIRNRYAINLHSKMAFYSWKSHRCIIIIVYRRGTEKCSKKFKGISYNIITAVRYC